MNLEIDSIPSSLTLLFLRLFTSQFVEPFLLESDFAILRLKTSASIMHRFKDRESPCFIPLEDIKYPSNCPFIIVENLQFEMSLYTMSIMFHTLIKTNFLGTLKIDSHDMLS